MLRRLGGVPKARGHIQSGKSYKIGVLQHRPTSGRFFKYIVLHPNASQFCDIPSHFLFETPILICQGLRESVADFCRMAENFAFWSFFV